MLDSDAILRPWFFAWRQHGASRTDFAFPFVLYIRFDTFSRNKLSKNVQMQRLKYSFFRSIKEKLHFVLLAAMKFASVTQPSFVLIANLIDIKHHSTRIRMSCLSGGLDAK